MLQCGCWATVVMVAALAGCDGPADRSSDWSYLHAAIVRPSCATAGCHSELSALAGVDLSTPVRAYVHLTGHGCDGAPGADVGFVRPGQPDGSQLLHMLRGDGTELVMPPDLPLPDAEIALIERWILEGATCD